MPFFAAWLFSVINAIFMSISVSPLMWGWLRQAARAH
jgi:hypothetical protein